jgi:hypothetical protein
LVVNVIALKRTSQGLGFQVLVAVLGDQPDPPLTGMVAAVQLAS